MKDLHPVAARVPPTERIRAQINEPLPSEVDDHIHRGKGRPPRDPSPDPRAASDAAGACSVPWSASGILSARTSPGASRLMEHHSSLLLATPASPRGGYPQVDRG